MGTTTKASITYEEMITTAAYLYEPDEIDLNPEYLRGQVNLIADCFGIWEMPVSERMDQVETDLRERIANLQNGG